MISIITVCYNAADNLKQTIDSIMNQNIGDFEYIIKDGGSSDQTCKLIDDYNSKLKRKLSNFLFLNGVDNGIYNAMNIATNYSKGDYLLFINAGDELYAPNTIELLNKIVNNCDVYYGNIVQQDNEHQKMVKPMGNIDSLKKNMFFCHQAAVIKRSVMCELKYKEKYMICADYDFFLRAYLQGKQFSYIDQVIAIFKTGGVSYKRPFDVIDESYKIQEENGIINIAKSQKLRKKNLLKKKIISLLPVRFYEYYKKNIKVNIRKVQYKFTKK